MQKLHIDIVSDIACPWCAIGFARLRQAMARVSEQITVTYQWRAFELDPEAKPEPILAALARKYHRSEEDMRSAQAQMMATAEQLGLNFKNMQQRFTANTFNAHRLIHWANSKELATALTLELFDAYFGRAEDVGDREVLLNCVDTVGLNRVEAAEVLDNNRYADDVRQEQSRYTSAGVNSVPAFIVNQRYLISGAQDSDTLAQALQDIAAEQAKG